MPTRDFLSWWLPAFLVASALFTLFPGLDIVAATPFWGGSVDDWPLRWSLSVAQVRQTIGELVWLPLIAVGVGALARWVGAGLPAAFNARAFIFLAATYALGPGLLANLLLKGNWGRARPRAIEEFGGSDLFTPAWLPSDAGGASFVSGEVSLAAATCAVALLAHGWVRAALFALGVSLAAVVGVVRIAQGGHFPSDVVFAMLLTWLVAWLVHSALFRWGRAAVSPVRAARPPTAS